VKAKILYCEGNTDGTIGGSYYSLLFLIEGLKGTRYDPLAVFHREHRLLPRFARACGEVCIVPKRAPVRFGQDAAPAGFVRLAQRALNLGRFAGAVREYAGFLRQKGVGLVHLNNSVTRSHEWMLAALWAGLPCVVHERGINGRFSRLTRLLAPRLSAIICISEAVRRNLVGHAVSHSNLRVIHNGLDPNQVAPIRGPEVVRRALGIGEHRRVVGLVGNIKEWKGQEVLIRALPQVLPAVPNILCLLVGATSDDDRWYEKRLRRLVQDLGLSAHVNFCGAWDNIADVLNVMEVAVHASVAPEPFGRVLLEAMAMRKPVVGSHAGAVPEIVEGGVTGYTFPPGDPVALAARLAELLLCPQISRTMGEAGRRRLERHFSIEHNVASTLSVYSDLLAGGPAKRGRRATC